jgi:predicted ferric reductase
LLAIRRRWLENFFGGLNRVYIAHHITGGIALAFLAFHPLFLALRYIETGALATTLRYSAHQLLPQSVNFGGTFSEVNNRLAFNAGIIAFLGMVILLVLTLYIKLPYRLWLFSHKFLGAAFVFAGFHILVISSDVSRTPFLFYYMLFWVIVGMASFTYRTLLGAVIIQRAPYKVERVFTIPGNTVIIEMSPVEKKLSFEPGQFVFIRFLWSSAEGISKEVHPFSIASSPDENMIRLFMKNLGDYTSMLGRLKVGTIAEIEGAYGKFSFKNYSDASQIWVAGGIGVSPFLSMARSITKDSPPIDMFYSVVNKEELVDQLALNDFLPNHYTQFKYHPYVTSEKPGLITSKYIAETSQIENKEIFICGPAPMMKSLRAQFRAMGVPNRKIHTEEFTMS